MGQAGFPIFWEACHIIFETDLQQVAFGQTGMVTEAVLYSTAEWSLYEVTLSMQRGDELPEKRMFGFKS